MDVDRNMELKKRTAALDRMNAMWANATGTIPRIPFAVLSTAACIMFNHRTVYSKETPNR